MTEPEEFQGLPRSELVRLVVCHRELRRQSEAKCDQLRKRMLDLDRRFLELAGTLLTCCEVYRDGVFPVQLVNELRDHAKGAFQP